VKFGTVGVSTPVEDAAMELTRGVFFWPDLIDLTVARKVRVPHFQKENSLQKKILAAITVPKSSGIPKPRDRTRSTLRPSKENPLHDHRVQTPRQPVRQLIRKNSPVVVETDFAELEDGTLLEMIEDPNDCSKSALAVFKDGEVRYEHQLRRSNRVFVPIPRNDGIVKHLTLPSGARPYGSVQSLLGGISLLLSKCLDVDIVKMLVLASLVVSTWVPEQLPIAPYLALVGLPHSGKTTLLRVLNLLCRRSLLTSDLTAAAIYQAYSRLTPTLLIDETVTAGDKRNLFHILRAGTTPDAIALRKNSSYKAFGPKVVSWIELPSDHALNTRCVIIPMQETTRIDLVKPTDARVLSMASVVRQELLYYRLANYKRLRLPSIPGDEQLHARERDLYQAFGIALGGEIEFCKALVDFFKEQQEINRQPLVPGSAAIVRVLYVHIHLHPNDGKYGNGELTQAVNRDLLRRREILQLNEHAVGRALTSLGLTSRKRTNSGYILWLDLRTRKWIHKLAKDHGIDQQTGALGDVFRRNCDLCKP
jgi:hypothetical protein